jgi:N-acetylmuramoyl-L-alanine amidase
MDKWLLSWSISLSLVGINLSGTTISANPITLNPSIATTLGTKVSNIPNPELKVVYPPPNHETLSDRIFFIGTAPANIPVTINGKTIRDRSSAGHFAPTLPLQLGENTFILRAQEQTLTLKVTRKSTTPPLPTQLGFAPNSLTPAADTARLPMEPLCFSAVAPLNTKVRVRLGRQTMELPPQNLSTLPPNAGVLTGNNEPAKQPSGEYRGCTVLKTPGVIGKPTFEVSQGSQTVRETGPGNVTVLSPEQISVVEVTADQGVARTGPSTDYSRLTPLPKGTQARITGKDGEWLRLDYGGWIKASEVRQLSTGTLPQSLIRSVRFTTLADRTEVRFPLQVPVPVSVTQNDRTFTLTLHNTIAQTDTILQNRDAIVERLDWQQVTPNQIQYQFWLRSDQQWGYKLRYEGTTLVLTLRHPPKIRGEVLINGNPLRPTGLVIDKQALAGIKILLDPGHGSINDLGSVGPTGVPEKDITLIMSKLLAQELEQIGATVVLTRTGDEDLYPQDRVKQIETIEPTLALSIHYNALPDNGDAQNTNGVGMFWYHGQSHHLAQHLHDVLVGTLNRSSYGVFWNNLALTRPTIAPSVLLELGFMTNPQEFEWITDENAQQQLAKTIAYSITSWITQTR